MPSGLSWLLRTLPVLKSLASADRQVVVRTETSAAPLLQLSGIDPCPLVWSEDQAVHQADPFQEAFLLHNTLADAWWAWRQGIARRWGYRGHWNRWLLSPAVPRPRGPLPVDERFHALLTAAGVPMVEPAGSWLQLPPELVKKGQRRLARAKITVGDSPLVGLYAGNQGSGSGGPWPRQDFLEVLRQMRRRHPHWRFVILATVRDLWVAVRLHEDTGKIHPVIGPDLDSVGLAGLMSHLDLVVAGDSWLLQLAAACGAATVGLLAAPRGTWALKPDQHISVISPGSSLAPIEVEAVLTACDTLAAARSIDQRLLE